MSRSSCALAQGGDPTETSTTWPKQFSIGWFDGRFWQATTAPSCRGCLSRSIRSLDHEHASMSQSGDANGRPHPESSTSTTSPAATQSSARDTTLRCRERVRQDLGSVASHGAERGADVPRMRWSGIAGRSHHTAESRWHKRPQQSPAAVPFVSLEKNCA